MMASTLRTEIIAVGSEMLTPDFQDTNSLEITRRLNALGLDVAFKTIVGDEDPQLSRCLQDAMERSDLIFTMGGLGPTRDDRTRESLAEVLSVRLEKRKEVAAAIEKRFHSRGWPMTPSNIRQAFFPEAAVILPNPNGTAPGFWLEHENRIFICLPGPPRELIPMLDDHVLPRLESFRRGCRSHRILKITGMGESRAEDEIAGLNPDPRILRLTILASPGQIELHMTAMAQDSPEAAGTLLDKWEAAFRERLGDNIFSSSGEELEEVTARLLFQSGSTLATAESCTGGLLGHRLTNVPGSSAYFLEGRQVYSNASKIRALGVPEELLKSHGAVSRETAECMASRIREMAGADYGLAVTGIAGPGGGTPEKPVGLVYTSLAWAGGVRVEINRFFGGRPVVKRLSSQKALDMLRRHLLSGRPAGSETGKGG
jgi:nicotinamide-nucleotide amidase